MSKKDLVNEEVKEEQDAVEATENVTETSENDLKDVESNIVKDVTPEKKHLSKKKKATIITIVAVILIAAIAVGAYFIYQNSKVISLVIDTVTVEYGETYTPDVADFVEADKINNSYTITGEIPNEDEKEYPAIGEYAFVISAEGKDSVDVNVIVQDTTAPVFAEDSPTEISTFQDVALTEEVLSNTFTVTDVDGFNFSIDDSVIDYSTVGEYNTIVYAIDYSGNVSEAKVTVIVKEPTINIEQANVSLTVGETTALIVTVQGASQDVTYSSSDESVATVDESGVVTAVKAGEATITAESNGKSTTVTITVTSKTSSSSNNTTSGSTGSNSSSSNNSSSSSRNNSSSSSSSSSSGNTTSTPTGTHTHNMPTGDMGWFSSKSELISYYQSIADVWNNKYESGEITYSELMANVPRGYECWSCSSCGMWSGNFKYK